MQDNPICRTTPFITRYFANNADNKAVFIMEETWYERLPKIDKKFGRKMQRETTNPFLSENLLHNNPL